MSSQLAFSEAVTTITNRIAGKNIDGKLQAFLNENFPPGGEAFDELAELCRQGIDEGWLCANERGGVRYGRVIDQGPETNGFSVDVVIRWPGPGLDGLRTGISTSPGCNRWQSHRAVSAPRRGNRLHPDTFLDQNRPCQITQK
jgi:hypothetical protein